MNDLERALGDIRGLRRQVALRTEFRGFGPVALVTTGVFAAVAAVAQALWIPDVRLHAMRYVALWGGTAILSLGLIAVHAVTRSRRMHSGMADEMIRMAGEQFLPTIVVGGVLTAVMLRFAGDAVWMLPGLWQILFGLGVFASCRFLPGTMVAAGVWYAVCGLMCIALGGERALAPWTMGAGYGAGQALIAAILWMAAKEEADEVEQ